MSLSQQAQQVIWGSTEGKKNPMLRVRRVHHGVGSIGAFVQSIMDPIIIVFSLYNRTYILN